MRERRYFFTTLFLRGMLGMELSSRHTFSIFVSNFCERMPIFKIDWGRHKWLSGVIMLAGQPNWRLSINPSKHDTRTKSQLWHGKPPKQRTVWGHIWQHRTKNGACRDTFEEEKTEKCKKHKTRTYLSLLSTANTDPSKNGTKHILVKAQKQYKDTFEVQVQVAAYYWPLLRSNILHNHRSPQSDLEFVGNNK